MLYNQLSNGGAMRAKQDAVFVSNSPANPLPTRLKPHKIPLPAGTSTLQSSR
jgi:hypothetical protein